MSWVPAFEIGVWNAWWFMMIYPLQWLIAIVMARQIGEKTQHPGDLKQTPADKTIGMITQIVWVGATLYSIFLPFKTGSAWLFTGLAFFVCGVFILFLASLSVARVKTGTIFNNYIYRFSRHPMYLSMVFVYIGVSVASASWLFFLITVITFFLQRHQAIQEEGFCCVKFGDTYRQYMTRTPRWLGIPKSIVNGAGEAAKL